MNLAIIGKSFPRLTTYLSEAGHRHTVFRDVALKKRNYLENTILVDFGRMNETISQIQASGPFDGIFTIYEQYITNAAEIADALNLPGLTRESAIACTNKAVMREKFSLAPRKISPDYKVVNSWKDISSFMETHAYPVILKPANLAKSLLVSKSSDERELNANYGKMLKLIDGVYEKYAPRNERIVLIEEFMEGTIHSIDAFVGQNPDEIYMLDDPVDYETGYDIGFEDNFHYSRIMPSRLPDSVQQVFKNVAKLGVQALEMTNSAAHIEIIVTNEGPRIVEIGARNGGYRERMHLLSNGIDIYGAFLDITSGKKPDIRTKKHDACAVLEIFPRTTGKFQSLRNIDALKSLPSFYGVSVKYRPSSECGKSSDGFKAAAVVVLHSADENKFREDLEFIRNEVSIIVN